MKQNANSAIKHAKLVVGLMQENVIIISFFSIAIVGGIFAENFFSLQNINNVLKQSVPTVMVSMAMLMIIVTGGIDLSVGSVLALLSVIIAKASLSHGLGIGVFVGLMCALLIGMLNGALITYGKMAPFIATLVTMSAARGLALIISDGTTLYLQDSAVLDFFSEATMLGIPILAYGALLVVVCFFLIKNKTYLGRFWVAIGSNKNAAYFAGINVKKYELIPYVLCAIASTCAAFAYMARTATASPIMAQGFELDVIAAVVIGGARMSGGRGSVLNTLIGALILGLISNLMNLLGIPGYHQQIIKGILIAIAVLSENLKTST